MLPYINFIIVQCVYSPLLQNGSVFICCGVRASREWLSREQCNVVLACCVLQATLGEAGNVVISDVK